MKSGLRGVSPARVFARPAAEEIWLGPTQASALSLLSGNARIAGVCGGPACGRSLLLQRAYREAAATGAVVLPLAGNSQDARHVLTALLAAAGLGASHLSPVDQRNLLHLVIGERLSDGRRVLVFVDDIELLVPPVLDELERLSHFSDGGTRHLEIRFACRAATTATGELPALAAHGDCVALDYLDDRQLEAYVRWRLDQHGLPALFTRTALLLTRRYTGGVFRAVDSLCRLALLLMQHRHAARVDVQCVNQAAHMLRQQRASSRHSLAAAPASTPRQGVTGDPGAPAGRFIVTDHGTPVMRVALARRLLIGRAPSNDICISGVEISRYHAMIEASADRIEIIDLNSANGIRVNGERRRQSLLEDRDIVTIGTYKLKLETPITAGMAAGRRSAAELPDTVVFTTDERVRGSHLKSV